MPKPEIAGKTPAVMTLAAGEYHWCACGRSQNQPFCDGSHRETEFTPLTFNLETEKKVALCVCKQTRTPPYCDGTHKRLDG